MQFSFNHPPWLDSDNRCVHVIMFRISNIDADLSLKIIFFRDKSTIKM